MDTQTPLKDGFGHKFAFCSSELPSSLSEAQRFEVSFHDVYAALGGACQVVQAENRPVYAAFEGAIFGDTAIVRPEGNISRFLRTSHHVAHDKRDAFHISYNMGASPLNLSQCKRESLLGSGQACLISYADALDVRAAERMQTMCFSISAARLRERIGNPEELLLTPLDPDNPALRHLQGYLAWLLEADEPSGDPALAAQIETTLIDLAALVLGTEGDSAVLARMRGLRRARMREVLAAIRHGYASPDFTASTVAARLGLSRRYVQDLLQETGCSFSERVTELRLQRARSMLGSARFAKLRITDIALASGFSDISYFNRCFRRRFGMPPGDARSPGRP